MKQKRKVKSLLPQKKDWRSSFLTALLLILSVALCIGSASLITSRVWAAEIGRFSYTGLDDKQEVVYGMRFVNKNDMQKLVSEIYVKDKSLYIVPNSVVVNESTSQVPPAFGVSNQVKSGVYGHVLGGYGNVVKSENVTLIAGSNTVMDGNDNAVFLGGKGNNGDSSDTGTPMVMVGGNENSVGKNHNGVVLIGGKDHIVEESVSNAFLLGGENNEVKEGGNNVIVGGKKVTVENTDNVFVYSNKNGFGPKSSNAFYLNMGGGVGINTDASDKGLAVKGPVSLGVIDIKKEECNSNNLGVEGSYQGCVVGCTDASENEDKWEMLDRGQKCLDICADSSNANYCIFQKDEEIPPKPDYKAFCTEGVDLSDAELCFPDELSGYQNVIFETSLVDNGDCDKAKGENKCVYQCMSGYHLAEDTTQALNLGDDKGKIKCFKDCDLTKLLGSDWINEDGSPIILKHNQTITAYNKDVVPCSYDKYGTTNPEGYSNSWGLYLDNGYGTKRHNRGGLGLENGNKNRYRLPEHCGNNAHKQKLVCANETLYILSSDGKTATTKLAKDGGTLGDGYLGYKHDGYIYQTCKTEDYTCDTSEGNYQWSKDQIVNSELLNDTVTNRAIEDRAQFDGKRGKYKLCLDYKGVAPEKCEQVDTLTSTKTVHDEHYKFMGCQKTYHPFTGEDGVVRCMKECTVQAFDSKGIQKTITREHKKNYEFYLSGSETCTGVCESQRFECNDGTFYQSGYDGKSSKTREKLNYKYSECGLHDNMCNTGEYNVTASVYEQWKDYGTYISCDDHLNSSPKGRNHKNPTVDTKYNKQCVEDITHYKLVDCNPGYHTEDNERCIPNVWDEPCENKPNNSHWVRETQVLSDYPWSNLITKYLDNKLLAGKYLRRWDESCDWNGPKDSCKTDELQDGNEGEVIPGEACKWECNTGYRDNGGYCQKIDTSCQYPEDNQNACMNTEPYACKDQEHTSIENQKLDSDGVTWRWDCVNGIESDRKSCMLCKDGYHIEGGKCVKNIDGECNNNLDPDSSINYACNHGTPVDKNSTDPEKYTWDCAGTPTNYDAPNVPLRKPGPDCSAAEDDYGCYKCKVGYHKTSTYGECEINTYTVTYNGNGGTPDRSSDQVDHGDYVDSLPGATRSCYEFSGWDGKWSEGSTYGPVVKDVTLYARWNPVEYAITYDCGDGTELTQDVKYGGTSLTLYSDVCSKQGYKLLGWSTSSTDTIATWTTGATVNGTFVSQCTNKTLYAVYKKIINGQCDESEPYGCVHATDTAVDKGEITSGDTVVGVSWYCESEDNVRSSICEFTCDNDKYFDIVQNKCKKKEVTLCCPVVPPSATEIIVSSSEFDYDFEGTSNSAPLCEPKFLSENGTPDDDLNQGIEWDENQCYYEHKDTGLQNQDGCGHVRHCCMKSYYGSSMDQIECGQWYNANCSAAQPSNTSTKKLIGFRCNKGYKLDGCMCVLDSPNPIVNDYTICRQIDREEGTRADDLIVNVLKQNGVKFYTQDGSLLPFKLTLKQSQKYWTRDGNGSTWHNQIFTDTYVISQGKSESEANDHNELPQRPNSTSYGKYTNYWDWNYVSTTQPTYEIDGARGDVSVNIVDCDSPSYSQFESDPACGKTLFSCGKGNTVEGKNEDTKTWVCRADNGSVRCQYSCTDRGVSCPEGYIYDSSNNKCKFYYKVCANKLLCGVNFYSAELGITCPNEEYNRGHCLQNVASCLPSVTTCCGDPLPNNGGEPAVLIDLDGGLFITHHGSTIGMSNNDFYSLTPHNSSSSCVKSNSALEVFGTEVMVKCNGSMQKFNSSPTDNGFVMTYCGDYTYVDSCGAEQQRCDVATLD